MTFARPVEGPITSRWDEPRPLSHPGLWNHGAIDIVAEVGTPIIAPEAGWPYAFCLFRPEGRTDEWIDELKLDGATFPWTNYRHDVFGAVLVLKAHNSRVHLFTHIYFNQVFEAGMFPKSAWHYQEQWEESRFPMFLFHTFGAQRYVHAGEQIGRTGDAGYSTGPHVHWEISRGWTRTPHADRIDPEEFLEE